MQALHYMPSKLTVIVPLLEPLISNCLRDVDGPPWRVWPLPEPPQPEEELPGEIPELIVGLLPRLDRLSRHRSPVQPRNVRQLLPQLPVFLPVREFVLLQLHLIDRVRDLLGPSQELHNRTARKPVPPLLVLFDLFGRQVLLILKHGLLIFEDLLDLGGVAVIGEIFALPEVLIEHALVLVGGFLGGFWGFPERV